MDTKQNQVSVKWAAVILGILVVVVVTFVVALSLGPKEKVTDFESCKQAGGAILETYPEQCNIHGNSYTNESQVAPKPPETSNLVGMKEADALAEAKKANTPARVVERDGEALPVTMDFVFGRLNLSVRDNLVYKVDIEGYATDT